MLALLVYMKEKNMFVLIFLLNEVEEVIPLESVLQLFHA